MIAQEQQIDDRNEVLFGDGFLETLEYLHIVARKILSGQMKAERRSRQKGVSVEFADHRPYAPGDDFRFIDWGVYFRTDQLFLKLFEEDEDLQIYFLIDCSGSMDFGVPYKFHYARRLAAAVAYLGLARLDRVSIVPFSSSLAHSASETLQLRGKGKVFRMLNFLEGLTAQGETKLLDSLRTFSGSKRKRGLVVLISDLYDGQGVTSAINMLRIQKFEPYVIHVVSPQEVDPAQVGDLRLLDCESSRFRDVTITESLLRRYHEVYGAFCGNIEQFCRSREVGYVRCRTDVPFKETVVHMLRRGKLLQ
jgi:uncharacterized protein (DUF58 family)